MAEPRTDGPVRRGGRWRGVIGVAVCLLAGLLFFTSLDRLWPLAAIDLAMPREQLRDQAAACLRSRGFNLEGFRSSSRLVVDGAALDYTERAFGREQTQEWIAGGAPLFRYRVYFKKAGDTTSFVVEIHPRQGVVGFIRHLEDDEPGSRIDEETARQLAREALAEGLRIDLELLEERSSSIIELPERRDHSFRFERVHSREPELRERFDVRVAGDAVSLALRSFVVPGQARREARAAEAPGQALEAVGLALLGIAVVAGFFIFLGRLRDGSVELGPAVVWPSAVFACLLATYALQDSSLFVYWEPLWPRWISSLRYVVLRALQEVWLVVVLLAVVAAGYALDSESGARRGLALRRLGQARLLDPLVAAASARGFLIGLLCGGAMTVSLIVLQRLVGAQTSIQPRGFFFYPLNSLSPAGTSLLFFFGVALAEELGYRFFGGSWIWSLTRRRWLAILIPALIYGLTHTRLDFLPAAEPFWARTLILTVVGLVWGWAFFRYDALTVVLSHFTADLFIFNWPRLATARPDLIATSALVITVPLLPALLWLLTRWRKPAVR